MNETSSQPQGSPVGSPVKSYGKLLGMLTVAALVLMVLGYLPSLRLGGQVALEAMLIGTAISWFGCALAGIPLVGMGVSTSAQGATPHLRMLLSTGLRVLVVGALTAVAALGGLLPVLPLLIWVATSYFFLLFVDTGFAFLQLKQHSQLRKHSQLKNRS